MEKVTDTWITAPKRPVAANDREACLVHIYPTGPQMGQRYPLADKSLVLGRGDDCDIRIVDHSVSRRHARIDPLHDGYEVVDTQSTNGTFVNDAQITNAARLNDGDYLRVGNCIYRFLTGGNVEAEYHEEIYRLTIQDALTQIANQRFLMEFLERELARSARHARPLSVVMLDIDWFKAINDEYGHLGGDFTLRELAGVIRGQVRREDLFARYGGEEFALVLVETPQQDAIDVADRIRQAVSKHTFHFDEKSFQLTVSMGVAFTCGQPPISAAEMVRRADAKLYDAKRGGRNRVVG
jgi:two-component system cell cycle response regulator